MSETAVVGLHPGVDDGILLDSLVLETNRSRASVEGSRYRGHHRERIVRVAGTTLWRASG